MNASSPLKFSPVVVGLGEALFDCLPDKLLLGGAPLNMIAHVHRLLAPVGGRGVLVSRIGEDELGKQLLSELKNREISGDLVQVDSEHPTGMVNVGLTEQGEPCYDISYPAAWDYIDFQDGLERLADSCDAVCFGTLAQRSEVSRSTIQRFVKASVKAIRMLDVNLRGDYASADLLRDSLGLANVVKLNRQELLEICELHGGQFKSVVSEEAMALALLAEYKLELVVLTRGRAGTVLITRDEIIEGKPVELEQLPGADPIGAGDACCAGVLYGLLRGWPLGRTLELANYLGAFVASQPGATPRLSGEIVRLAAD